MHIFQASLFSPSGKMEEKITWALMFFICAPRALQFSLILLTFHLPASFVPTWKSYRLFCVCAFDTVWHPSSNIPGSSRTLKTPCQSSREKCQCLLTGSYQLQAPRIYFYNTHCRPRVVVSSCRSWESETPIAARALYLFLLVELDGRD